MLQSPKTTMCPPCEQLPAEVWTHIFGFLSAPDRLNVRASSKYFQELIDNKKLWKGYILKLTFPDDSYNERFWSTIGRWRVSSAVVRGSQPEHWTKVTTELPDLTSMLVLDISTAAVNCLKHFTNLTRLCCQGCTTPFPLDTLRTVSTRLTHLSFCGTQFSEPSFDAFLLAVSEFTGLTSLVVHKVEFRKHPEEVIHSIVASLPCLTHLSVYVSYYSAYVPRRRLEPLRGASLFSLEIVNYEADILPEYLMRLFPTVRSLAVFFQDYPEEETYLESWLNDLPHLVSLVISKGPHFGEYGHKVPPTVTSVTLSPGYSFDPRTAFLIALMEQVPHLRHLHLGLSSDEAKKDTRCIPYTFRKLQTLKIFCEHVPEKDFLGLVRLRELRRLEVLDRVLPSSALIHKLQRLSNNRITVQIRESDVVRCPCVSDVY